MLLYLVAAIYGLLRVTFSLALLRGRRQRPPSELVSVIVAARDEAESLPQLLSELVQQSYEPLEIVVVNDRSTDATAEILSEWQARDDQIKVVEVRELPPDRSPKMHALAQGVTAARGDIFLLIDADCRAPRTWAASMTACFTPGVGAVTGYVDLRAPNGTLFEHIQAFDYFAMMATAASATRLGAPIGAAGANLGYRREAYRAAGGFEDMPSGAVADDMLLIQRVLDRTGWRVAFCDDPRAFVSTAAERSVEDLLHQRLRWMAGGKEVLHRNPLLLFTSSLIGLSNGLLLSAPFLWLRRDLRRGVVALVVGRVLADLLHLGVAAPRFGATRRLQYYPLWLALQAPYSVLLPLVSFTQHWTWKGRER